MFQLPLFRNGKSAKKRAPQPFSAQSLQKSPRIADATLTESVCPYCAVGCGLHIYTKRGRIIDIEGNPNSPINEGTLCPKRANSFQSPRDFQRVPARRSCSDVFQGQCLCYMSKITLRKPNQKG